MPRSLPLGSIFALVALAAIRAVAQPMVLDPTFAPRVDTGRSILDLVQYAPGPNGQILVFGSDNPFYVDHVRPEHGLVRLNSEGAVDVSLVQRIDASIDEHVQHALALPDGRMIVSTRVTTGATTSGRVLRLLSSGLADPTFAPSTYSSAPGLTLGQDGTVLVWGSLSSGRRIARLLADGSADPTFHDPDFVGGAYGPPEVTGLAAAPDGGLVIRLQPHTGRFFGERLYRLKPTGEIDTAFAPPAVFAEGGQLVAVDSGNRVLVLTSGIGLRRLSAGGAVDSTFQVRLSGTDEIQSAVALAGGRIAVQAVTITAGLRVPSVCILEPDGSLALDARTLPGAERIQKLLGGLSDGRVLIAQGRLIRTRTGGILRAEMDEPTLCVVDPAAGTLTTRPTAIDDSWPAAVSRLALDASGRILVEGDFERIAGQRRPGLARFSPDRTLDPTYVPIAARPVFHQPDGRIIARRTILSPADADGIHDPVKQIVRLNADGTLDPSFTATKALNLVDATWLAVAADGRILVVENAEGENSTWRLAWLAPDGSLARVLATTFPHVNVQPGTPAWTNVSAAAVLPDGKLLVFAWGGINGLSTRAPVRLNADGTTDTSYQPDVTALRDLSSTIPLPDGRAYAIGPRAYADPTDPLPALRLNADGSPDTFVAPALAQGIPLGDGTYLFRGRRFRPDGNQDLNFTFPSTPGFDPWRTAVVARDGSLWIGGTFASHVDASLTGYPRTNLARLVPAEVAGFTVPPANVEVFPGFAATFHAELGTAAPATFQWTHQGTPIAGATQRTLRIAFAGPADAGEYRLVATVGDTTYTSAPATLTVRASDMRLVNFSARSAVAPGYPPQIGGLVLRGTAPRRVLLRAVGRGLPVDDPGFTLLPEPALTLFDGSQPIARDAGGALATAVIQAGQALGAVPLRPTFLSNEPTHDSALLRELPPGVYTAQVASVDGRAGISLFEFYDGEPTHPAAAVANVSVRGRSAPGGDVLIAGFVITGHGAVRMLIRGLGPALTAMGVPGVIANPQLTLYRESEAIGVNDDWSLQPDAAELSRAAGRTGARALPQGSRDASLLVTLPAGIYSVHGRAADGTPGEMLIELFVLE